MSLQSSRGDGKVMGVQSNPVPKQLWSVPCNELEVMKGAIEERSERRWRMTRVGVVFRDMYTSIQLKLMGSITSVTFVTSVWHLLYFFLDHTDQSSDCRSSWNVASSKKKKKDRKKQKGVFFLTIISSNRSISQAACQMNPRSTAHSRKKLPPNPPITHSTNPSHSSPHRH